MQSLIKIFKVLANDEDARQEVCDSHLDYDICDFNCDSCVYESRESIQRAANVLANRFGDK